MCIIHSYYTHPSPFLIPLSPCQSISFHVFSNLHVFFIGFLLWSIAFNLVFSREYGYGAKYWGMRDSPVVTPLKTIPPLFQASIDNCSSPRRVRALCYLFKQAWVECPVICNSCAGNHRLQESMTAVFMLCSVHANKSCFSYLP